LPGYPLPPIGEPALVSYALDELSMRTSLEAASYLEGETPKGGTARIGEAIFPASPPRRWVWLA